MNVQGFSLQGERCGVYPKAEQVVILQAGSSGCCYRPGRWASGPTPWPGAPRNTMQFRSLNKASSAAACRPALPFGMPGPLLFPPRAFPWRPRKSIETEAGAPHTLGHRLCGCRSGGTLGFLRQDSLHVAKHTSCPQEFHRIIRTGQVGDP